MELTHTRTSTAKLGVTSNQQNQKSVECCDGIACTSPVQNPLSEAQRQKMAVDPVFRARIVLEAEAQSQAVSVRIVHSYVPSTQN